jgi:hypothetical protein
MEWLPLIPALAALGGLAWGAFQLWSKADSWRRGRIEWRAMVTRGMSKLEECWQALHNHIPTALHELEIRLTRVETRMESHHELVDKLESDIEGSLERVIDLLEKDDDDDDDD